MLHLAYLVSSRESIHLLITPNILGSIDFITEICKLVQSENSNNYFKH